MIVSQRKRVYLDHNRVPDKIDLLRTWRRPEVPPSNINALCSDIDRPSPKKELSFVASALVFILVVVLLMAVFRMSGSAEGNTTERWSGKQTEHPSQKSKTQLLSQMEQLIHSQSPNQYQTLPQIMEMGAFSAQQRELIYAQMREELRCAAVDGTIVCKFK